MWGCLALWGCGGGNAPLPSAPGREIASVEWLLQVEPPSVEGVALSDPLASSRRWLPSDWTSSEGPWRFHLSEARWEGTLRHFAFSCAVENRSETDWRAPLLVVDGIVALNEVSPDDPTVRSRSVRLLPPEGGSLLRLEGSGGGRSLWETPSPWELPALAFSPLDMGRSRPALPLHPDPLPPKGRSQPIPLTLALSEGLRSLRLRVHLDILGTDSPSEASYAPEAGRPLSLPVQEGKGTWRLPGRGAQYLFVIVALGQEGREYPLTLTADVPSLEVSRREAVPSMPLSGRPLCDIGERLRRLSPPPPHRQRPSFRQWQEGQRFLYTLSIPGTPTQEVEATVLRVGRAGVWVTETTNVGRLSVADLDRLQRSFEERILPRTRLLLGPEPDVNGDGHFLIFLTQRVNDVGRYGFFLPQDLSGPQAMEVLYSALPDFRVSLNSIEATMAHELQHAYHYYYTSLLREQVGNALPWVASVPINEGLSFLMEELTGFGDESASGRVLAWRYLQRGPEFTSLFGEDAEGEFDTPYQRGMAYLLLRYLFERAGGAEWEPGNGLQDKGGGQFLYHLLRVRTTGLSALDHLALHFLRRSYLTLFQDWALALALDGTPWEQEPYGYASPLRDPDTQAQQGVDLRGSYTTSDTGSLVAFQGPPWRPFQGTQSTLQRLRAHSVGYTLYRAPEGAERVLFRLQAEALDDALRAWVLRQ